MFNIFTDYNVTTPYFKTSHVTLSICLVLPITMQSVLLSLSFSLLPYLPDFISFKHFLVKNTALCDSFGKNDI